MATRMRRVEWWVVYRMAGKGSTAGGTAVCTQDEWNAMELARPGHHTLVRDRIANEGEAERLARGTAGDTVRKVPVAKIALPAAPDTVLK